MSLFHVHTDTELLRRGQNPLSHMHTDLPRRGQNSFAQSAEDGEQVLWPLGLNDVDRDHASSNTEESKPAHRECFSRLFYPAEFPPPGCKIEESKTAPAATSSFTYSPYCHGASAPGSKIEEFPRTYPPSAGFSDGDIAECRCCLKVGEHGTAFCPYMIRVPKNERVGSGCAIVCRNCGSLFLGKCCGLDEGRAILKRCFVCGGGGHWSEMCPRKDRVDKSTQVPLCVDLASDIPFAQSAEDDKQDLSPLGLNGVCGDHVSNKTEESEPACRDCFSRLFYPAKFPPPSCKTEESKPAPAATSSFTHSPLFHRASAPGSKIEEFPRTYPPSAGFSDGDIVECRCCLKVGEHGTAFCPYMVRVPKNERVGSSCEIVCRNCGSLFLGKCCGLDEGRAILKRCFVCGGGGHWSAMCPRKDRVGKSTKVPLCEDLASGSKG